MAADRRYESLRLVAAHTVPRTASALAVALGGIAFGAALGVVGSRFGTAGPLVLLGLGLVPLLAALAFQRPVLALFAVYAAFPFGTATVLPTLHVVEFAIFVAASLVSVRRLSLAATPLPWAPQLWWPLALLAWSLVALHSAADSVLAVKEVAQLAAAIVFACLILAVSRSLGDLRVVLGGLVVAATGIVAVGLVSGGASRVSQSFSGATVQGRLSGSFSQPNQLGSFCALALLLAVGLIFGARTRRVRLLVAAAAAVIFTGLILSFSRGAWIGTAVGTLYLLLRLPQARRALVAISVPVVAVVVLTGSYASARPELQVVKLRAAAITARSPYDQRSAIWAEAAREVRDSPLTGVGPANFPVASTRAASASSTVAARHAHNIWLNWAAEAGIPAALLLIGFAVVLGTTARRAGLAARRGGDVRRDAVIAGIVAALLSVVVQGEVDYTLTNAVNMFSVWAVIGALLACRPDSSRPVRY
jgi:O-antigen ligase